MQNNKKSLWTKFKEIPLDKPWKTMVITVVVCLVASLFVTYSAITLRPVQEKNKIDNKRMNVLQVAGLYEKGKTIDEMFSSIDTRVVDLRTGQFTSEVDATFDERKALKDTSLSRLIKSDDDFASIRRQSFYKVIYLVKDNQNKIEKIILPIHGYGLWSTLYGFISVKTDGNTITALKFYEHAETPGLGGEVDNPIWQKKWFNKKIYSENGEIAISVVKSSNKKDYHVDALSGATLTSNGVHNLVRFWLGQNGFQSFLKYIRSGGLTS